MRFDNFLKLINEMSLSQALEIFGMQGDELGNPALLKKKFRDLSQSNHPDHGGDVEVMKSINVAYALLKTSKAAQTSSKINWDDINKKYQALGSQVKAAVLSVFKPEVFIMYFNQFSPDKFEFEMKRTFPKETERSPSFAGFVGEFFTSDRETIFTLDITVSLSDIANTTGLGYNEYQYPLIITTYGFHNNRKQKIKRSDWNFTNDHSFFTDPSKIYPSAKMKKIFSGATSKRTFKKRDFQVFMAKKCKADIDNEWCRMPLVGEWKSGVGMQPLYKLTLYRSVFMKQATWMINGIYKKMGKISRCILISLPETEESAKMLFDLQKQCKRVKETDEAVIKKVNDFLKAYKAKQAAGVNVYA